MNSKIAKIITAIYALLYGGVNLILELAFFSSSMPTLSLLINIAIVAFALTLLFVSDTQVEKIVIILLLATFGTNILRVFFNPISFSRIFSLSFSSYVIPVAFTIIYFIYVNKAQNVELDTSTPTLERRLNELEKVYINGLLSTEEYLAKRKKIIDSI